LRCAASHYEPTWIALGINGRAAGSLGSTIVRTVLLGADEVIQ
jgi:hypothetical protein